MKSTNIYSPSQLENKHLPESVWKKCHSEPPLASEAEILHPYGVQNDSNFKFVRSLLIEYEHNYNNELVGTHPQS